MRYQLSAFILLLAIQNVCAQFPIANGIAAVTQYSGSVAANPSQFVLQTFSVNNYAGSPSPVYPTSWAVSSRYSHPTWTVGNLGQVWGIDMDRYRNIYVAASAVYSDFKTVPGYQFGPGGPGGIYKINGVTGAIALLCSLPNSSTPGASTPSIGNISVHPLLPMLYATNLEDGKIYRVSTSTGAILSTYDPFDPDNALDGIVDRGERLWGIKVLSDQILFSRWSEDDGFSAMPPAPQNEIWKVLIDPATGEFTSSLTYIREVPSVEVFNNLCCPGIYRNNPVSDIEQSPWGGFLFAQRMFRGDGDLFWSGSENAYSATAFAYLPTGFTIPPTVADWYEIGSLAGSRASGGGISAGYRSSFVSANPLIQPCDDLAWLSGADWTSVVSPGYFTVKRNNTMMGNQYVRQYNNSYAPYPQDPRHIGDIDVFDKYCRVPGPLIFLPRQYMSVRSIEGSGPGNLHALELEALQDDVITHVVLTLDPKDIKDQATILCAQAPADFSATATQDRVIFSAKTAWSLKEALKDFVIGVSSTKKSVVILIDIYAVGLDEPLRIDRVQLNNEPRKLTEQCFDLNTISIVPTSSSNGMATYQWCFTATNNNPLSTGPAPLLMEYVQVTSATVGASISPVVQGFSTAISYGQTSTPVCFDIIVPISAVGSTISVDAYLLGVLNKNGDHQGCCPGQHVMLTLPSFSSCCDSLNVQVSHTNTVVTTNTATVTATVNTVQPYRAVRVSVLSASATRRCKDHLPTTDLTYAYLQNGVMSPFPSAYNITPSSSLYFGDILSGAFPTGTASLTFRLPAFDGGNKCTDTFNICLRWEFIDANCNVCDTVTCISFFRNKNNIQLSSASGSGASMPIAPKRSTLTPSSSSFMIERIQPNPTSGYTELHINSTTEEDVDVTIVDLNGATISSDLPPIHLHKGTNVVTYDLSSLTAGTYMIILKGTGTASTSLHVR